MEYIVDYLVEYIIEYIVEQMMEYIEEIYIEKKHIQRRNIYIVECIYGKM